MPRPLITTLQLMIAAALAISVYGQVVLIPTAAADDVAAFPPYAPLQTPLVTIAIAFVVCVQAGLVAALFLLRQAGRGSFFTPPALGWTNVLVAALIAGLVVTSALFAYVSFTDIPSSTDGMSSLRTCTRKSNVTLCFASVDTSARRR